MRINIRRQAVRVAAAMIVGSMVLFACGGEATFPDDSFSVVVNSDIGTGSSHIQLGVIGPDGERLGSPEEPISVELAAADGHSEPAVYPAEWMWLIPDIVGLYRAEVDLPRAGPWALAVIPEAGPPLPPSPFQVLDPTAAPSVGDPAPAAPIETLATKPIEELSSDPEPDEDFYWMTMEEAFTSGRKTVLVFSTPAFCQTATCGPTLEFVKIAKSDLPDVNFIHVEVYSDINAPGFTPGPEFLHPALGPEYWNLPTEPWVFVVDEAATVIARFEGALTSDDIADVLS